MAGGPGSMKISEVDEAIISVICDAVKCGLDGNKASEILDNRGIYISAILSSKEITAEEKVELLKAMEVTE
jgi:hypothetical protein